MEHLGRLHAKNATGAARGATDFLSIGRCHSVVLSPPKCSKHQRCIYRFPSTKSEARWQEFSRRNHPKQEGAQNGKGASCWTWSCSRVPPPSVPAIKTR